MKEVSKYAALKGAFEEKFGKCDGVKIYSAPGRVEIGGNHTDHQGGRVLAAAINLETVAVAAQNGENIIRAECEGYGCFEISLSELSPREDEKNTTAALIRGVAKGLAERGINISGVDMYISSEVLSGSGLSSSAAFEVAVATALSDMAGEALSPHAIAEISAYAEREFFGKPCGLMDQMASAFGGIVAIDFASSPAKVRKIEFDLRAAGYDLVIVDVRADHADLTDEYAAIPREMGQVAAFFGKARLSEVSKDEFYEKLSEVRKTVSDRAICRAIHYLDDSDRAGKEAECFEKNDFVGFLALVNESGNSSFKYLQNIYATGDVKNQAMAVGLALAEQLLSGRGAVRVHGGGFGGTLQAFVPTEMTKDFINGMEKVFGSGSSNVLSFRAEGGIRID